MNDEIEKFFNELAYKSAHSLAKLNPEELADFAAETAIKADRLEKEIERLKKYEQLVWFIANDYHELSHDKAKWQRDDWKKRCQKLMAEDADDAPIGHTEHELKDLDF